MYLGRVTAWVIAVLLATVPVRAQSVEFVANLASGDRTVSSGIVVQPFLGDTGATGWAVVTTDSTLRTISYRVTVVNAPGIRGGRLFVAANGAAVPVIAFGAPVPMAIVLNNISDDLCYETSAISFEGTVGAAELALGPEQGIRRVEDVFAAIAGGKAYVAVESAGEPAAGLRGQLAKRN
jgi:hypothetical protein